MRRQPTDSLMTLEEVGAELGVTRERVRQIEKSALQKLRILLEKRGITCSDDLLAEIDTVDSDLYN